MIRKDVQNLELDFYLDFVKKAQANPEYWQQSLQYIKSAGSKIMAYAPAFKSAADKISSSHAKLEQGGVTVQDIQKAISESSQAGAQEPTAVRQASGFKNKLREIRKFSRKYNSIKGDENKIVFLKRSGVIDENGLMKLGMNLEAEELIKKGFLDDGNLLLKISTEEFISYRPPDVAPAAGGAATSPGLFGKIKGMGAKALNWVGTSQSWIARGFRFLGKIFRWLGVIWELFQGVIGLGKAIYGVVQVMSVAPEVQLSAWDVLSSASYIDAKIELYKNDPDKLTKLAYVAEAASTFWRGIVAVALTPIFTALQFGVMCAAAAAGAATAPSGPLAGAVTLIVGAGLGTLVSWLKSWIQDYLNSAATAEYVAVSQKIQDIISGKINPTQEAAPMGGGYVGGGEAPVSDGGGGEVVGEGYVGGESTVRSPAQARVPTRREMRRERRMTNRALRQERRTLRREDRAARRAARRSARGAGRLRRAGQERLEGLIKLANSLDDANLIEEADMVDDLIYQIAG